jgi:hypothetical protein
MSLRAAVSKIFLADGRLSRVPLTIISPFAADREGVGPGKEFARSCGYIGRFAAAGDISIQI